MPRDSVAADARDIYGKGNGRCYLNLRKGNRLGTESHRGAFFL